MVDPKRHHASSPWQMPLPAWKDVLLRVWKEQSEDNISLAAAGVAFYGFLALVPLLGAIVLIYGIAADPQTVLKNVKSLTSILPAEVAKLIGQQLMSVVQTSGGKKGFGLLIAIAVALWGARNAATSIITALNIAYEEHETRSTVRLNLLALGITAGGVVMAVLALLAITGLGYLQRVLPHAPDVLVLLGKIVSYVALLLGAAAGAATLYRYAPSRAEAKWQWITPGSLFAAVSWLILTFGFGFYVAHFGNYNKTYGSLATVVILVTWLYLSAYLFLLGAELNSEFEKQTAQKTTEGPGKQARDRQGWSADVHPANIEDRHPTQVPPALAGNRAASAASEGQRGAYVAARVTNRAAHAAGLAKVGMISAILSTLGLSLLRKRGRELGGAALLAGAVGLSLLNRNDDQAAGSRRRSPASRKSAA
jgi:membrane protein